MYNILLFSIFYSISNNLTVLQLLIVYELFWRICDISHLVELFW